MIYSEPFYDERRDGRGSTRSEEYTFGYASGVTEVPTRRVGASFAPFGRSVGT